MKIVMNVGFDDEKLNKIRDLGYEVVVIKNRDMSNSDEIADADIWYTYDGFSYADISEFKNLKYVHLTSTGINQVPKEYIKKNNILLSNNTSGYSVPIAECVVMYILEVYKNSKRAFKKQEEHRWHMDMSWLQLAEKRVGFLGTGSIAKESVKRLKGFDVEIWGVNTDGRDIEGFDKCYPLADSREFFETCDVIVGCMPETGDTTKVIDEEKLKMMKEDSILINVGRGNLIDLDALVRNAKKFKGVVLDVIEKEPLHRSSLLWDMKNVIITPHNSWVSEKTNERRFNSLYTNLKEYKETGLPKYSIQKIDRGY